VFHGTGAAEEVLDPTGAETLEQGLIVAICLGVVRGQKKQVVGRGILREDYGLVGDAHAGGSHYRQISLLGDESIDKMRQRGLDLGYGIFGENIVTRGIRLYSFPVGTTLAVGSEALIEITQIGKRCHRECRIRRRIGQCNCIMPEEAVFAHVVKDGVIRPGDRIKVSG